MFISGRGSNFQAILNSIKNGSLNASINVVISDNKDAKGLSIAQENNIPTATFNFKEFSDKSSCEQEIINTLSNYDIDYIILAGYMRIVGDTLILGYHNKILNIHPSLLPSFKGLDAQKQAFDYGVKVTGCTVHFVNNELDGGPIILQEVVEVLPSDTVESLSNRILDKEHVLYSKAINILSKHNITIQDNKVIF